MKKSFVIMFIAALALLIFACGDKKEAAAPMPPVVADKPVVVKPPPPVIEEPVVAEQPKPTPVKTPKAVPAKKAAAEPAPSAPAEEPVAVEQPVLVPKAEPPKVVKPTVRYSAHVEKIGWLDWTSNGGLAGTTGEKKQMEAIRIEVKSPSISGGIRYQAHITGDGWVGCPDKRKPCNGAWVSNGKMAGTTGQSKRMEAIRIELTGELAEKYSVRYNTHVKGTGWLGWSQDGEIAGTTGQKKQLEAIRIELVEK